MGGVVCMVGECLVGKILVKWIGVWFMWFVMWLKIW